ncbi:XrtA-associated ATPase [Thiohalobacter sp. IOR34]|uniref:XrtA/PEP-CTERM system-associated ATPase n=1 Tax=Thiohalobacter sp. IOR34 TaxID=3057176 RepID=UPI0025AFB653|nr:XrtA/PEP-CTERM system-associated ATPase [Thiohalobacter sp. IOR34]WJW74463.1 XrtA-associated ATPase [Thiohalobacter sp. IOR34]
MYERFYNLKAKPFRLSPDPRFLYQSKGHAKALAYLRYGLQLGEGFIIITGEIGAGKTTLARTLLESLQSENIVAGQLVTTQLQSDELLRAVCSTFGLQAQGVPKAQLLKNLEVFLMARAREGRRVLLVVDEAQNLPAESLEELRMLSNYQVGEKALMQSFLLGQGEFQATVQMEGMEQFRQRVIASYHLGPMDREETQHYIEHRLTLVNWKNDPAIDNEAYDAIYEHTGGIPRRINTLCDRLFLYGCLEETHQITGETVRFVVDEQQQEISKVQASVARSRPQTEAPGDGQIHLASPSNTVTDAERRLIALEKKVEALEERVRKDRDRIQKLIMMAVLSGDDVDFPQALESLRKAD